LGRLLIPKKNPNKEMKEGSAMDNKSTNAAQEFLKFVHKARKTPLDLKVWERQFLGSYLDFDDSTPPDGGHDMTKRNAIAELEAWVHAHKQNHCEIGIDNGYGATCWAVTLRQAGYDGERRLRAIECHEQRFPKSDIIAASYGDDCEFVGLQQTILTAMDYADEYFGDEVE